MLIADPSSTCDVCLEKFSSRRGCWSIPCGHMFCRDCLSSLNQPVCPLCRTAIGNHSHRRMHVDMAKCDRGSPPTGDPDARMLRLIRKLERQLVTNSLEGHERASELANEIREFLRNRPSSNESALLKTIETLLNKHSAPTALVSEDSSLSIAIIASYEDRIKQLEKSLREQSRHLAAGRSPAGERSRHTSHTPGIVTTNSWFRPAPRQGNPELQVLQRAYFSSTQPPPRGLYNYLMNVVARQAANSAPSGATQTVSVFAVQLD